MGDMESKVVTGISTDARGFVRVDGVPVGRKVTVAGTAYLEFKDRNRNRSQARGATLLRVPIERFIVDLSE